MKFILTKIWILSLTLLLVTAAVQGQKTTGKTSWEDKPIDQWNEADVKNILNYSPWSQIVFGRIADNTQQVGTIVQDTNVIFTLRSSLIVRYAIIRSEQLKSKYDRMDEKAKIEFAKRLKPILDCPLCEKFYIVSVTGNSDLLRQGPKVKNRAANIWLSNEKGERRELASYSPQTGQGTEALFFFNRYDANGKPLLTPENETLTFNFRVEATDTDRVITAIERVTVKVRDIVRENRVIF